MELAADYRFINVVSELFGQVGEGRKAGRRGAGREGGGGEWRWRLIVDFKRLFWNIPDKVGRGEWEFFLKAIMSAGEY